MKITETKIHESCTSWIKKGVGRIFVDKAENLKEVFDALVEQDDYWESYSELVKVIPENATISDIARDTIYVGKTDIYDVPKLIKDLKEKGIEIFIWSDYSEF